MVDVIDLTCDASAAFWGLPSQCNNLIFATETTGSKNLSALLRTSSSSLRPLSLSLSYIKRIRTNRSPSLNGILDSLRGGGADDEEEYDDEDEDETDYDSEEVLEDNEDDEDDNDDDDETCDDDDVNNEEGDNDKTNRYESSDGEHESVYDEYDDDEESEYDEGEEIKYNESRGLMTSSTATRRKSKEKKVYDEPLALSSMQDMGVTLGVMVLCTKLDLTHTRIIRVARYTFIAYVILAQLFLIYARLQAHKINDKTPISISNPLSNMLKSQLGSANKGDMIKNVANSILSTESTVMEYDLSQARSMNNGLLFPMVMLYFLHFKMGQVQPLFYQTANGIKSLITSPLFQVYALGRNLERPFQNPLMDKMKEEQEKQSTEAPELWKGTDTVLNQSEEDSDVEDTEESDDFDSDLEEYDSDEDPEY